ncbi:MAG: sodium:proton antiporter [Eubacterium sp.]|jgi:formate hydrogenlyase subunit 3/multisubunit Na+/H+ antiporter MnhD subunit|nr:sodium:proton antiporter [Eubacterium sp.]
MEGLYMALLTVPSAAAAAVFLADWKAQKAAEQNAAFRNLRDALAIGAGAFIFILMCILAQQGMGSELYAPGICGLGLHFCLDGFRGVYGIVAAFMWMMTLLFSREYLGHEKHLGRYYFFQLVTLNATLGVFLSADLFTTFIFFEIMSFTSYVWVAQEETKGALKAAETYLAVAVIGGLVLLMGLFLLYHTLGTLEMSELLSAAAACEDKGVLYIAGVCALVGFGAKAGAFPLHIWLPKAHPVAPAPASALLSGILTKAGVFGILAVSSNIFLHDQRWGLLLLFLGLCTMFGGALLAVFSVDLKRTLACSSMSQIGFILTGIGMQGILGEENGLAARGTLLHMVNHSLIKLALFMIAGVVVMNLHKLDLNDIRGFGRKKPLLNACFLAGALGISGIPLFNGYISKTLLHESIVEGAELAVELSGFLKAAEWVFLFSGGMTLAYMTKLYVALFVEKNSSVKEQKRFDGMRKYMNPISAFAIVGSSAILPVLGFLPHLVTDKIADLGQGFMNFNGEIHAVSYFSFENLKGGLISIGIGAALYWCIRKFLMAEKQGIREYRNCWPDWLDMEGLIYRPLLLTALPFLARVFCRIFDSLVDGIVVLLRKTIYRDRKIPHELPEGSEFTHLLGEALDWLRNKKRRILRRPAPEHEVSFEHRLAMQREKIMETNTIIQRSLSFGLLLFYVGLVFTLIYLLYLGKG